MLQDREIECIFKFSIQICTSRYQQKPTEGPDWANLTWFKGCSHGAITTTNFLSQLMGCVGCSVIDAITPYEHLHWILCNSLAVIKSRSRSRFLNSPWTSRLIPYSIIFINFSEHVLKALNSLQTTEEKLAALCKKYADLHEEHRILQTKFKQSQKKLAGVWQTFFCLYEITSKQTAFQ